VQDEEIPLKIGDQHHPAHGRFDRAKDYRDSLLATFPLCRVNIGKFTSDILTSAILLGYATR